MSGGTYVGYSVHHAARIVEMGHGGQTLLSAATAGLVEHDLPDGVRLRALGEIAIADADRPQRLFQLDIEGLRTEFPTAGCSGHQPRSVSSNAPTSCWPSSSSRRVGAGRFGVIVGDAGIGKTTLVSEVRLAAELRGMEVLQARGGELEHDFSYGIVRQLFESRLAAIPPEERHKALGGSASISDQLFEEGHPHRRGSGPSTRRSRCFTGCTG